MLVSHRVNFEPSLGVRFEDHWLLHSRFRVRLILRSGMLADDAIVGSWIRPLGEDRNFLVIPLRDEFLLRRQDGACTLRTGEAFLDRRNNGLGARQEGEQFVISIEWEPGSLGTRLLEGGQSFRLSKAGEAAIRERALVLVDPLMGEGEAKRVLHQILELLRAEGVPFDPCVAEDLEEPVPEVLRSLSRALDWGISSLATSPTVDELADCIGRSPRQTLRAISEFNSRFKMQTTGGWREMAGLWRIALGCAYMSTPGATTEFVARRLGYARPGAFRAAFAQACLPSPSRVRSTLLQLS